MRRRLVAALLGIGLGLGLAGFGASWQARRIYAAPGPLAQARDVVVAHGSLTEVAGALHRAGVVASSWQFRLAATLTRGQGMLHAAEFAFPAHASLARVLAVLRTARPVQHRLTIPEGLTASAIAALFARAPALTGAVPHFAEGAVLPQSYDYEYGTPRAALLARAEHAMDATLAKVWEGRAPGLPLATPRDLLTLASLIERETALPEERALVAAVFMNRLRQGMRLQSDPTVIYAASAGAGTLDHPLTRAELALDSPYNTYRMAGLPPGPIASPGLAALTAAAHPAASDALYFVADGSGGHVFAHTLAEHNRNVAAWRARHPTLTR
ncbi:MAG: endolytic transglycosylase MltG [Rhodospirillales bacterium]|nr:endolytic transglycosylase MltG [Rhodospirillales bacterium]